MTNGQSKFQKTETEVEDYLRNREGSSYHPICCDLVRISWISSNAFSYHHLFSVAGYVLRGISNDFETMCSGKNSLLQSNCKQWQRLRQYS